MSRAKALIMAVCLLLLGLLFWRYETQLAPGDMSARNLSVLTGVSADNIEEISVINEHGIVAVERRDAPQSRLEKEKPPPLWLMRSPEGAPASSEAVNRIIRELLRMAAQNVIKPEEIDQDQGIYGLSPPEMVLTLKGSFGRRVMSFGKRHAMTKRRYLQPENDQSIYLVEDDVFAALNIAPETVRDRNPLRFRPERVRSFTLIRAERPALLFTKNSGEQAKNNSTWTVGDGLRKFPAEAAAVTAQLKRLADLRIKTFLGEPEGGLKLYGLTQPLIVVALYLEPGMADEVADPRREIVAQIGKGVGLHSDDESQSGIKVDTSYYLKVVNQAEVFELEQPHFAEMLEGFNFYRSRSPYTEVSEERIAELHIAWRGDQRKEINLKRDSQSGSLKLDNRADASKLEMLHQSNFREWLKRVREFNVISFLDIEGTSATEYGFDRAEFSWEMKFKNGDSAEFVLGERIKQAGAVEPGSDAPYYCLVMSQGEGESAALVSAAGAAAIFLQPGFLMTEQR